jgi:hypothetical protein
VNLIVVKNGQVVVYDDVTLVSPTGASGLPARPERPLPDVGRRARQGDRRRRPVRPGQLGHHHQFGIDLEGMLKQDFLRGILVPDRDDRREATAYNVDVITPNDDDTMDAGEMNANIAVRPGPVGADHQHHDHRGRHDRVGLLGRAER